MCLCKQITNNGYLVSARNGSVMKNVMLFGRTLYSAALGQQRVEGRLRMSKWKVVKNMHGREPFTYVTPRGRRIAVDVRRSSELK